MDPEIVQNNLKQEMQKLLMQLPSVNAQVLMGLCQYFILVSSRAEVNRMTINNILTCFTPTLLCSPAIIKMVVEDFSYYFP
jgi:hypothetical protein